jgi:hypothetical protein
MKAIVTKDEYNVARELLLSLLDLRDETETTFDSNVKEDLTSEINDLTDLIRSYDQSYDQHNY